MKQVTLAVVALVVIAALMVPALAKDMRDVPFTHWAYDAVDELTDLGIIQGYPDGTFGGSRTLTRYEFAEATVKLVHYLENYVDEKTAALESGVDATTARSIAAEEAQKAVGGIQMPSFNMTLDQVKQAAAQAGAAAAQQAIAAAGPGLSKADAQAQIDAAVKDLVSKDYLNNLVTEFRSEIQQMGVDVDDLTYRVDQLETKLQAIDARVTALENQPPRVTGELIWRAGSAQNYAAGDPQDWQRFSNLGIKINLDGQISDTASGHVTIWRPDATYDWDERGTHVDTAYVDVQDGLMNGLDWRLGKQYYKAGCGLTFDNSAFPLEGVKLHTQAWGLDLTGIYGMTDFSGGFYTDDPEDPLTLITAGYDGFGRLGLQGTYVFRAEWGDERWGATAMYPGIHVPFVGLRADFEGEYAIDKSVSAGSTDNDAWYTSLKLHRPGYQPGDWQLKLSYAECKDGYWPYLYAGADYNSETMYSGLPWDFLLSDDSTIGPCGGLAYSASLTKQISGCDVLLRYTQWNPWSGDYIALDGDGTIGMFDTANLYQASVTKDLAEGVALKLTWARLNDDVGDDYDYVGGSIDVGF